MSPTVLDRQSPARRAVDARLLLERAGRHLAFHRRFPAELGGGRFAASTEGGLRYLFRRAADIDPHLVRFARDHVRPGHVVWDVGANLGYFSFLAAGSAGATGRVVAIEPDVWLADVVSRTAQRQPAGHAAVDVVPAAVSDGVGIATLHIARRTRSCNFLTGGGTTMTGGVRHRRLVPTTTLDDLVDQLGPPDVVKVDIESYEDRALTGAGRLLHEVRPVVLVEVGRAQSPAVTDRLHRAGYSLVDWDSGRPIERATIMTLAVPG